MNALQDCLFDSGHLDSPLKQKNSQSLKGISDPKIARIFTPVGEIILIATEGGLSHVLFADAVRPHFLPRVQEAVEVSVETPIFQEASRQIAEYFQGKRKQFTLPLCPEGSGFYKKAWRTLEKIPFGSFSTYGKVAKHLGMPRGARSIGGACNRNPIALLIPCHRVVGSNYTINREHLVGYAGGIERKIFLLAHERSISF